MRISRGSDAAGGIWLPFDGGRPCERPAVVLAVASPHAHLGFDIRGQPYMSVGTYAVVGPAPLLQREPLMPLAFLAH